MSLIEIHLLGMYKYSLLASEQKKTWEKMEIIVQNQLKINFILFCSKSKMNDLR